MKRLLTGLLVVILMLTAVACASRAPEGAPPTLGVPAPAPTSAPRPAPAPAPPPVISIFPSTGKDSATMPVPAPAPAQTLPLYSGAGQAQSSTIERMIVQTGNMALVVTDVAASIENITRLAGTYNGYVVASNSWRENNRLIGMISIRIPAERFEDGLRALRQMAVEVNSESTSSQDVTEEYIDLSARLRNLEASEQQLLALMEKAGKVEEILQVQQQLTATRSQIEQTRGRMQYLEQTSKMSYIEVNLEQASLDVTFTASRRTVKAGENIRFNPEIGGGISPYSYEWQFGDGGTSTDVAPVHSYKSTGSYDVTLKVTDDKGQTATEERSNYIDVIPGWSAGNVVNNGWNGLLTLGRVFVNIVIFAVFLIPLWIVLAVILYFAWWRRRRKKA